MFGFINWLFRRNESIWCNFSQHFTFRITYCHQLHFPKVHDWVIGWSHFWWASMWNKIVHLFWWAPFLKCWFKLHSDPWFWYQLYYWRKGSNMNYWVDLVKFCVVLFFITKEWCSGGTWWLLGYRYTRTYSTTESFKNWGFDFSLCNPFSIFRSVLREVHTIIELLINYSPSFLSKTYYTI